MRYVNILNSSDCGAFLRQIDSRIMRGFSFFENSDMDIDWDYVVVYEEMKRSTTLRCKKGGLVFMSGESEDGRYYCTPFLKQFDILITSHSRLKKLPNHFYTCPALNWHYGFSLKNKTFSCGFNDLLRAKPPEKSANISVITSNTVYLRGHLRRVLFLKDLRKRYGNRIDFFGKGVEFIDDKAEALLPYRFHIVLENSARAHYWTEKLSDPLLAYAVPIYDGAPNVGEYFPQDSMYVVDIDDRRSVFKLIDGILEDPCRIYSDKLPALTDARKTLLDKYNFFAVLERVLSSNPPPGNESQRVELVNNSDFPYPMGKIAFSFLKRIKRLSYRLFSV